MKIAIIGAGITGLTAAYRLSQKGHRVVVFEKEKFFGGLVTGFQKTNWQWSLENFYHHLFTSDDHAKNLIYELGLSDKLFFKKPKTSIFVKNTSEDQNTPGVGEALSRSEGIRNVFRFDSPLSLLKFPHLSFSEKIRTGLVTAYLKLKHLGDGRLNVSEAMTPPRWRSWKFEKIPAYKWLSKFYGEKPYQILWQPLIKAKFGPYAKQISMAWFWARIKKRSTKLGYLKGGFQVLIDKLVEKIKANGGEIRLNYKNYNLYKNYNRTIITTPTQTFFPEIKTPEMLGALNLILVLKKPFLTDGTYWLNVNEPGFPFVAVVEHTNFVNKSHYNNNRILYIGGYYPQNHRYFRMTAKQIFQEFLPYLRQINLKFNQLSVISYQLSVNLSAQPIVPLNYSQIIPPHQTPIPNVFLANMQQIYPWDRGINYAIEMGEKVANEVSEK